MTEPVLVTGGAGYIGSHCCRLLSSAGYLPIAYDNLALGHRELVRFGPLEVGDIRDEARLAQVFEQYAPKTVMHFAALSSVADSVAQPIAYYENNVHGALCLVKASVAAGVERFIFSSTAAVYGAPEVVPISVESRIAPVNPYGSTKAMIETVLADVCRAVPTFSATCFRYFNAAGADPDSGIGEWHEPETHLIPNALSAALRGTSMFMFGEDYPTADGTCVRDYVHVLDVAAAHIGVLSRPHQPGRIQRFNLGTGRGHSVKEIIGACERVSGKKIAVQVRPRRPGDPPELVASTTGTHEALGWTAERADLDSIVGDAWRWMEQLFALQASVRK